MIGVEDIGGHILLQKIHAAIVIGGHRGQPGHIAVIDVGLNVQFVLHAQQNSRSEGIEIVRGAVIQQLQQLLGGENVHLQRLVALGGVGAVQHIHDAAGVIDLEVGGQLGIAGEVCGADRGNIRAAFQMGLEHGLQVDVAGHIAVRHDYIILFDVLYIAVNAIKRFHLTAEVARLVREGGQHSQTTALTGQIPVLAAAQMIQQRLALLLHDHADVYNAGVDHVGEHEIDHAVAAAKGDRGDGAVAGQLTQMGIITIGEQNAVQLSGHSSSPPFGDSVHMAP